jgi:hypothetical protein
VVEAMEWNGYKEMPRQIGAVQKKNTGVMELLLGNYTSLTLPYRCSSYPGLLLVIR